MDNVDGRRLFVGGLNYEVTEDELRDTFQEAGVVEDAIIISDNGRDGRERRSKGYGFVTMQTKEEAQEAINKFNNTNKWKRPIVVSLAKPPKSREERRGGFDSGNRYRSRYGGNHRGDMGGRDSGRQSHEDDGY